MIHEPSVKPGCLIIPSAGLGTRMKEVSREVPKELLHVGKRPAIECAVDEGVSAGITQIIIVISREKEVIREHFKNYHGPASLSFLYQRELLGESDAIHYAKELAGGRPVAVIYPDNIYVPAPGAIKRLLAVYRKYNTDVIALNEVTEENRYGFTNAGKVDVSNMEEDVYRIKKFYDKAGDRYVPRQKSELRACGIYISGSFVFDYIERLKRMTHHGELTDIPVRRLILEEKGMLGCRLPGRVFDIGNPDGYRQCVKYVNK
jgi:UTP--glucose-1-phosphate uridylyltransferase